ncbi:MAG: hypothetical protein ACREPM_25725, partial [Gemmatimonadaceae bacterium]
MRKSFVALVAFPAALAAQTGGPAVRLIAAPNASTKPVLSMAAAVRQLPNGGILVNDIIKRQLVLFDPTLANATIVADSVSGGANSYGTRPGGIIPYLADSTLFVDPAELSMFVLGPTGAIARVASVPRSQDANMIGSNLQGTPGLDARGRIVYRGGAGPQRITMQRGPSNGAAQTGLPFQMPDPPDTAALVRIDPSSRKLDTATFIKIPKIKMNVSQSEKGMTMTSEINPMPLVDDWAVLSDGSIAIVRGRDYHIDWVNADGSTTTSAKLPFDWQRMTDDDKTAVIDSAKAAYAAAAASMKNGVPANGMATSDGAPRSMVVMSFGVAGGGGVKTGGGSGLQVTFASINDLPDYRPAFTAAGSVKADADDNVWIRTTAKRAGAIAGAIYDVVNRKGE